MARRKTHVPKKGPITIDAMTVWESQKPRFNGYMCGHGVHGKTKYDRTRQKQTDRAYINEGW